jgi:hypothetical protein
MAEQSLCDGIDLKWMYEGNSDEEPKKYNNIIVIDIIIHLTVQPSRSP